MENADCSDKHSAADRRFLIAQHCDQCPEEWFAQPYAASKESIDCSCRRTFCSREGSKVSNWD